MAIINKEFLFFIVIISNCKIWGMGDYSSQRNPPSPYEDSLEEAAELAQQLEYLKQESEEDEKLEEEITRRHSLELAQRQTQSLLSANRYASDPHLRHSMIENEEPTREERLVQLIKKQNKIIKKLKRKDKAAQKRLKALSQSQAANNSEEGENIGEENDVMSQESESITSKEEYVLDEAAMKKNIFFNVCSIAASILSIVDGGAMFSLAGLYLLSNEPIYKKKEQEKK